MGTLLSNYKKAIIDEIVTNITSNTSQYYAFAAGPVPYVNITPVVTTDDYNSKFINEWNLLFGKKLANTDILPMINYVQWVSNTVYNRYDNTVDFIGSNTSCYAIVAPVTAGGSYLVYKCIDNANGNPSTIPPSLVQASSFNPGDGYIWRYITSISAATYSRFSTSSYIPIVPNPTTVSTAYENSGVEVVAITNGGNGYISYAGNPQGSNSITANVYVQGYNNNGTIIQIANNSSTDANFYTQNGIYFYNSGTATGQLRYITNYTVNTTGKFVTLNANIDLSSVTAGNNGTSYYISPRVIFTSDADSSSVPAGYSVVNTTSNSVYGVTMLNNGTGVTWCNVSIVSNTSYGIGASAYAIVPPPGGHGADPANELNCEGFIVSFYFANSELSTLPTEIQYNKIGIIKNPYKILSNTAIGARTSANTFSQVLKATVSPSKIYNVGDKITSSNTNAVGTVAFSNSTVLYLSGDKYFADGDTVSNGTVSTIISINTIGDLYAKNIVPLYIQNVSNVQRANNRTESFRLIIKV